MLNQDYSGNGAAAFPYDEDTSYVSHIKIPIEPLNFTEFPGSEIRPKYNNKSQAYASMENTVSTPKQYPKTRFNDLASSPDFASLKKLDAHPEPPKYLNNTGGNFELDFKDTEEVLKKSEHRDYKVMDQQEKTKQSSKEKKRHKQAGQKKNNNAKQRKNKKASKKDEPAKQRKKQRNTGPKKEKKQKNTEAKPKSKSSNPISSINVDQGVLKSPVLLPKSLATTTKNSSSSSSKSKKRSAVEAGLSTMESDKKRRSPIKRIKGKEIDPVKDSWHGEFKIAIDQIVEHRELKFSYFSTKVDEKVHQAPNYYKEIDHPMHFGLIQENLEHRRYESVNKVLLDIELVLFNARLYNPPGNYVHDESKKIQKYMTKTDKRLHKIVQKYGTEADKNVWRDRYGLGDYGPFALDEDFLGDFITVIE